MSGLGSRDLRPILRLQSLEGGRKEITIFHHDVMPLVLYEVANDIIHILPNDLMIRQGAVDRLSDAAQTFGPCLVLASQITNLRSRSGITNSQLGEDQIFLGVVVDLWVNPEITDNHPNNLVVGPIPAVENLKLPFEDRQQLLDIAMLSA